MKKIGFILLFIFSLTTVFAGKYENVINNYLNKFDAKLHKIYPQQTKYCKYSPGVYDKLLRAIKAYETKYPKYKQFLQLMYKITLNKKKTILNQCLTFDKTSSNSIYIRGNYPLNFSLNLTYLDSLNVNRSLISNFNYKNQLPSSAVVFVQGKKDYFIKLNGKWYLLKGYSYLAVPSNDFDYVVKNANYYLAKYKVDYFLPYKKEGKIYLVKKENLFYLNGLNPYLSLQENLNILKQKGFLVVDDIYGPEDAILFRGILKYKNNLWGFSAKSNKLYYIPVDDFFHLAYGILFENKNFLLSNRGKLYLTNLGNYSFYYLGDDRIYNKINLNLMAKILTPTFYFMNTINFPYSPLNMKQLILFAKQFDHKTLLDLFKYMEKNFKYDKEISDFINKNSKGSLTAYIDKNKNLTKNWIDFYTLSTKTGVCQTLSDIFSLVALFNGLNADIVDGYSSNGNLHQISKVGQYYYDITYGLSDKTLSYFGMTEKELNRYFSFK